MRKKLFAVVGTAAATAAIAGAALVGPSVMSADKDMTHNSPPAKVVLAGDPDMTHN